MPDALPDRAEVPAQISATEPALGDAAAGGFRRLIRILPAHVLCAAFVAREPR
jgi:hypothetical protein